MPFDHEKLDVYAVALDFLVLANGVVERLTARRSSTCSGASTLSRTQRNAPVRSSSIASWRCS